MGMLSKPQYYTDDIDEIQLLYKNLSSWELSLQEDLLCSDLIPFKDGVIGFKIDTFLRVCFVFTNVTCSLVETLEFNGFHPSKWESLEVEKEEKI